MQQYKCPNCNNEINIGTENKRLVYFYKELKARMDKAIEILNRKDLAPTCRAIKALEALTEDKKEDWRDKAKEALKMMP
jgi:hypothetical protein